MRPAVPVCPGRRRSDPAELGLLKPSGGGTVGGLYSDTLVPAAAGTAVLPHCSRSSLPAFWRENCRDRPRSVSLNIFYTFFSCTKCLNDRAIKA